MIKRFIESQDSKSAFSLSLLANVLYSTFGNSNIVVKDELQDLTNTPNEKNHFIDVFQLDFDDLQRNSKENEKKNLESNLKLMVKQENTNEQQDCPVNWSISSLNNEELLNTSSLIQKTYSTEEPKLKKVENNKKSFIKKKLRTSKIDFFSSDSDSSESSFSSVCLRKREKKGKRGTQIKKKTDGEVRDCSDAECAMFESLLKQTKLPRKSDMYDESNDENDENKKKEDGEEMKKKIVGQKNDECLIDFLSEEKLSDEESGLKMEAEDERNTETDFFAKINDEVKNQFLLSSNESDSDVEYVDEEEKKITQKKMKSNRPKSRNAKPDEFRQYRISISSSNDEGLEWEVDSSEGGKEEELRQESSGSSFAFEQSSSSESGHKKLKRKKRMCHTNKKSDESSFESDESDESDVQVCSQKSNDSPSKGRKNIKKIFGNDYLQLETKQALKMETERKKRLSEKEKVFKELFPDVKETSRLILDFDPVTKEELVVVDERIAGHLKPHQREGVKFMWDCCFESLKRIQEDGGSGCILAHCMGLGKSFQIIALIHTLLTHKTGVNSILILCPLNTLRNWIKEFKIWLHDSKKILMPVNLQPIKSNKKRLEKIKRWKRQGGIMVISYEMFRSLTKLKNKFKILGTAFLDPGPSLVVCDEGHVLKNENSALSKAINGIKTLRRIVLTGTPMQNNLIEYYSMVQFVKPNIFGTRKEFNNRFVNPINNGQFEDSTPSDVRLMKRRAHVLHTMVDGFVQRYGYYVLEKFLPKKQEYVILVSLTDSQAKIYKMYLEKYGKTNKNGEKFRLFNDFHWLQKVWTHPKAMLTFTESQKLTSDLKEFGRSIRKEEWDMFVKESDYEDLSSSGKLVLLFDILKRCRLVGDKILVFSQYISSLNLIEYFLKKANEKYKSGQSTSQADCWEAGQDYFRMDGTTNGEVRSSYCEKFTNQNRAHLFLISTRAGGLGINLIGANRVVLFDASWNPSHDVQSIFRVYRFGQKKPCFIYRFLSEATMEEKIYKRQVNKLSLAHRILDEHQIERHYTMGNLQELYRFEPVPKDKRPIPKIPQDNLFADILSSRRDIIVSYHEHDSLLENKEEEELSVEERQAAWEEFETERQSFASAERALKDGAVNSSYLQRLNSEAAMAMYRYQKDLPALLPDNQEILNETSDQLCKIAHVSTLNSHPEIIEENNEINTEKIMEIAKKFGLSPQENESTASYYNRVGRTVRSIFSWDAAEEYGSDQIGGTDNPITFDPS